jgi:REP element-mobilizing transposase RayT
MEYKSNSNIVYSCKYHVVFCPKYRRPVLADGVDERFRQIARQVADELSISRSSRWRSCPTMSICSWRWTPSWASTRP